MFGLGQVDVMNNFFFLPLILLTVLLDPSIIRFSFPKQKGQRHNKIVELGWIRSGLINTNSQKDIWRFKTFIIIYKLWLILNPTSYNISTKHRQLFLELVTWFYVGEINDSLTMNTWYRGGVLTPIWKIHFGGHWHLNSHILLSPGKEFL